MAKPPPPRRDPWLDIPAEDYEGHMGVVGQLPLLARLLGELVGRLRPRRLALPGCATGGGLEHVDPAVTRVVAAVDLNPRYLRILRRRHGRRLGSTLVTVCADLRRPCLDGGRFDLVHAALLFEYLPPAPLLATLAGWLAPGGVLAVVVQLESERSAPVSDTPFTSLRSLGGVMRLVPPGELERAARAAGLSPTESWREPLPRGKAFRVELYRRSGVTAPRA